MSKVAFVKKIRHKYLVCQLSFPEVVSDRALKIIGDSSPEGFLPVEVTRKGNQAILTCCLDGLLPVKEYLREEISKKTFWGIISTVLHAVHFCQKNKIKEDNLDLQSDRIFINPSSGRMLLVYWPVVNNPNSLPVQNFLKNCIDDFHFKHEEDCSWIAAYKAFFDSGKPFLLGAFEEMFLTLNGMRAPDRRPSAPKETFAANSSRATVTLTCELPKNSAFDPFALIEKKHPSSAGPMLLRVTTGQYYPIGSQSFIIGSSPDCHLCISDNPAISRVHAEILLRFGRYYVVDRSSRNGTSMNGRFIRPEEEVELAHEYIIHFANEEFVFIHK